MGYRVEQLGEGTFNKVYKISNNEEVIGVFKVRKVHFRHDYTDINEEDIALINACDLIERSIRIWNEINPTLPARAFTIEINGQMQEGWLCPFIKGDQANDIQIVTALIDIYERTGRIVVDFPSKKNFITNENNQAVCVDIGYAIKLDYEYGPLPPIGKTEWHHKRKGSMVSLAQWRLGEYDLFFKKYYQDDVFKSRFPQSLNVVKSLLFLSKYMPDCRKNLDFLKNPLIARIIALTYEAVIQPSNRSQTYYDKAAADKASIDKALVVINDALRAVDSEPTSLRF